MKNSEKLFIIQGGLSRLKKALLDSPVICQRVLVPINEIDCTTNSMIELSEKNVFFSKENANDAIRQLSNELNLKLGISKFNGAYFLDTNP
jgi:hypothetical protein